MSDTCPQCEYSGLMMALNDGSSTRFCECGFIFHYCTVHDCTVQGRGPGAPFANKCSCLSALVCQCSNLVKVEQPGVLFCDQCKSHYLWNEGRQLYVKN